MMKAIFSFLLLIPFYSFSHNMYKTEFVSINGKKTAYSSNGLQARKPGEPLIVFESGLLSYKENFDTLFTCLPKNLTWLTYDRPGIDLYLNILKSGTTGKEGIWHWVIGRPTSMNSFY